MSNTKASKILEISINEKLQKLGVVLFVNQRNTLRIDFEDKQQIHFDIDKEKTTKTLENLYNVAKKDTKLTEETLGELKRILVRDYVDYLALSNLYKLLESIQKESAQTPEETEPGKEGKDKDKEEKYPKYIICEETPDYLLEAVIIQGKPQLTKVSRLKDKNKDSTSLPEIELVDDEPFGEKETFVAISESEYSSMPYVFKSEEDFRRIENLVKTLNLDDLFEKAKKQWDRYVVANEGDNALSAGDCIFSYS